jgi:hypothetical protein
VIEFTTSKGNWAPGGVLRHPNGEPREFPTAARAREWLDKTRMEEESLPDEERQMEIGGPRYYYRVVKGWSQRPPKRE